MRNLPLRSLLASATLLAGPAALADSTNTISDFDERIGVARQASSPSGATVTRAEMKAAVDLFLKDDQQVDAAERAHMGAKLASSTFLTGVTGAARKYLIDTHELNDTATTAAPLGNFPVSQPPAELYGAEGDLALYSEIREGYIPNGQGVANQLTLVETFNNNSGLYVKRVNYFTPISTQELIERLSTQYITTQPTVDEVEGALAYIHQIYRNSSRLYIASYTYSYYSGWTEGFVVAAVSSDRRFVRFVDVLTYGE
ncbi:hypothetical protein HPC49_07190 [Pyxidicoccus fallax]|uniref:Uncharacterized protein n=1 Tax=Pyxidicoccus fallax TaxID=394095 RepID=A0A848LTC8_9BACT|nr:hypothetical protein [Pyxidicoccus fallax]NMO20941.1 hypothetical protein [Pyxidicoccus fallax]NPC78036.1 hypothetical protein [Pyxidicoccus fallax]